MGLFDFIMDILVGILERLGNLKLSYVIIAAVVSLSAAAIAAIIFNDPVGFVFWMFGLFLVGMALWIVSNETISTAGGIDWEATLALCGGLAMFIFGILTIVAIGSLLGFTI